VLCRVLKTDKTDQLLIKTETDYGSKNGFLSVYRPVFVGFENQCCSGFWIFGAVLGWIIKGKRSSQTGIQHDTSWLWRCGLRLVRREDDLVISRTLMIFQDFIKTGDVPKNS
jgi:hypothetical protein